MRHYAIRCEMIMRDYASWRSIVLWHCVFRSVVTIRLMHFSAVRYYAFLHTASMRNYAFLCITTIRHHAFSLEVGVFT